MSKKEKNIRKNILAIDIGSGSLKIAIGDYAKDKLSIKKSVHVPLPEDVFSNGELVNIRKMATIIKQSLRKNKIRAKHCFCVFQSNEIITREVTIPSANKETIGDMAKFEVEQFLPVEMNNYSVQGLIMKELEVDDKPFAEVLVTAFPKSIIEQIHKAMSMAGLKPVVLDIHANAFSKLIENQFKLNGNDYHRDNTVAFIDMGKDMVSVNIFQKGKFRLNRIIKVGGKDLDLNIAKFLDIPVDQAELKKRQINNINYVVDEFSESSKVVNVVKSTMQNWTDEIMKIFRFYTAKSPGNRSIEQIYIYGGTSKINGMADFLESSFKIPVDTIKKLDNVEYYNNSPDTNLTEMLNAIGVMYRR